MRRLLFFGAVTQVDATDCVATTLRSQTHYQSTDSEISSHPHLLAVLPFTNTRGDQAVEQGEFIRLID